MLLPFIIIWFYYDTYTRENGPFLLISNECGHIFF